MTKAEGTETRVSISLRVEDIDIDIREYTLSSNNRLVAKPRRIRECPKKCGQLRKPLQYPRRYDMTMKTVDLLQNLKNTANVKALALCA